VGTKRLLLLVLLLAMVANALVELSHDAKVDLLRWQVPREKGWMQPRGGATENVETTSSVCHIRVSENRRQKEVVELDVPTGLIMSDCDRPWPGLERQPARQW
jgi:hypothetical protein